MAKQVAVTSRKDPLVTEAGTQPSYSLTVCVPRRMLGARSSCLAKMLPIETSKFTGLRKQFCASIKSQKLC